MREPPGQQAKFPQPHWVCVTPHLPGHSGHTHSIRMTGSTGQRTATDRHLTSTPGMGRFIQLMIQCNSTVNNKDKYIIWNTVLENKTVHMNCTIAHIKLYFKVKIQQRQLYLIYKTTKKAKFETNSTTLLNGWIKETKVYTWS